MFKIVVTGPYAAGKSTLVATFAEHGFVTTGAGTTAQREVQVKEETTVGMDFGVLALDAAEPHGSVELRLYGTPGQERFDFMWELLAQGADAFVLLVDGQDAARWPEARRHHQVMARQAIPGVVAVNRPTADAVARAGEHFADLGLSVMGCDATELDDVKAVLVTALLALLAGLEEAHDGPGEPPAREGLQPGAVS